VRGFAIDTTKLDDSPYDENKIFAPGILTAPCITSCIPLMQQLDIDPLISFGVAKDRVVDGFAYKEKVKKTATTKTTTQKYMKPDGGHNDRTE
jgi:hypothetical protein